MKTAIIILNWNGFELTKALLISLMKTKGDFFVIVADNDSSDDSLHKLITWLTAFGVKYSKASQGKESGLVFNSGEIVLYSLSENYGFAKGNNMASRLALQSKPQRILFLNNDTEVESDFLEKLENFQIKFPQFEVLTPLIFFYSKKEKIWNAGGKLFLGFRRYYYANKEVGQLSKKRYQKISFVTGCALYVTTDILDKDGSVFTDKFFFGEEDFDFSIRMKKNGVKMACVLDAKIYHKVGSSIDSKRLPGKIFIHFLNRFINVSHHYGSLFTCIWKMMYKPYIKYTLKKVGCPTSEIDGFVDRLYDAASKKDRVTAIDFASSLLNDWSGKEKLE